MRSVERTIVNSMVATFVLQKSDKLLRFSAIFNYLRSIERILHVFTLLFSPAGLRCPAGIDRGCQTISCFGRQLGLTIVTMDWLTHLARSHAGIDPMPEKTNLHCLKLLYCEFKKYEVMTMSIVGSQPKKKKKTQIPVLRQQNASNTLFLSLIMTTYSLVYPCKAIWGHA